jgi:hypothetical protein
MAARKVFVDFLSATEAPETLNRPDAVVNRRLRFENRFLPGFNPAIVPRRVQ